MTDTCRIVHCKREPYDLYIGRTRKGAPNNKWSNPFIIGIHGDRDEVIEKYRAHLMEQIGRDEITHEELRALKGKTLGCWCAPNRCHGEIIAEYVELMLEIKAME